MSKKLRMKFKPDFIVQDGSDAMALAAETVFCESKILMCYFHIKYNVSIYLPEKFFFNYFEIFIY